MKKVICIMLTTIFFCWYVSTSYAVEPIKKDEPAPYNGYIFSEEEELKIRLDIIEFDGLKEKYKVKEKQADYWQKNYFKLSDDYLKVKKSNNWRTTFYFIGGLVLGAGAVYLGGKVAKEI